MSANSLQLLIEKETTFVTDFEEIVDYIIDAGHVFLYDTSTVSSHELAFNNFNDLFFPEFASGVPILLTETIAKELCLTEDIEKRYLNYLTNFSKVLYIREEDLMVLLKVEFQTDNARKHYLIGTEIAFSTIQSLKEAVKEARRNFARAENIIYDKYVNFFNGKSGENQGELSLIWAASIIKQLPAPIDVTFISIDNDIYDYVERSFFHFGHNIGGSNKNKLAKNIYIASNDTMLQSFYNTRLDADQMATLISWYRYPDRKVIYQEKNKGLLNWTRQKEKISNPDFKEKVVNDQIQIIY